MQIKGLQKTSLIDYPDKICSTVFLPGCNLKCRFCHNSDLVLNADSLATIGEKEFFDHLTNRKGKIDAVTICGGEPTIHKDLPEFIKKIKDAGFFVKLDTNGTNPEMVQLLLDRNLLDYIAMDVKAPKNKYQEITQAKDIRKIQKSIEIIKDSGIDYEFRTTILPFFTQKDMKEILKLISPCNKYILQQFLPITTIDANYQKFKATPKEKLNNFKKIALKQINKVEIR